jgi:pimeloyl-ACP methyl ester carboxylesterase
MRRSPGVGHTQRMPNPTSRRCPLRDGRTLEYAVTGPEDGHPVVWHHGTPGSCVAGLATERVMTARGWRLITYCRAGYGGSDRHPGRDVAAVAADVAALADHLGIDRFFTAGASGGGPHTLATAALLPDRVLGAATLAGAAPYGMADLDFLAGMGQENLDEFGAALQGEAAVTAYLDRVRPGLLGVTRDQLVESVSTILAEVDRAALTGEFATDLIDSFAHGLDTGVEGWADDDLAFTRPWGFDLEAPAGVPVAVWQGEADLMVPFAHGRWLAGRIPGARAHLLPDEGHISIHVRLLGDVLDDLLAHSR